MRNYVLAVLLLVAYDVSAQPLERGTRHGTDPITPDSFTFTDGTRTCRIESDGAGICRRAGRRDWRFRLPVEDGTIVDLYFANEAGDLLLCYELEDGGDGWGQLVRVRRGERRPAWRVEILALNIAPPIRYGDSVLVAAMRFLARVDLEKGWRKWILDRAYRSGSGYEISRLDVIDTTLRVQLQDGTTGKVKYECFDVETGDCKECGAVNE